MLGLLLFFTVLGLSSTVAVLEQDTRLKRFSEEDLKLNLDSLRRGIDLYQYHYTNVDPQPAKITALTAAMASSTTLADLLANESFIRARAATGSMSWRIINNYVKNPSFEIDDGKTDFGLIGGWRGNYTANDGVPDGWNLNAAGAEQWVSITTAGTYVISFWARCMTATSRASLKITIGAAAAPALEITADSGEWKRYFSSFALASPDNVRIDLLQTGLVSGDTTFIDGLMLEKWVPPAGVPGGALPVASAWTDKHQIVPTQAITALKERLFRSELTPPTAADISSYSWWFQW